MLQKRRSPPVVSKYARYAPIGTATTTASSCSTQRASHAGRRSGACSNQPKASIASSPTSIVRTIHTAIGVADGMPNRMPNGRAASSVKRKRRHESTWAAPCGRGEGEGIMRNDSAARGWQEVTGAAV